VSAGDRQGGPTGPQAQRVVMQADQVLRVSDSRGVNISCERGTLWITQHSDGRDFVLGAGQSFMVSRMGDAVLMAMSARTVVTMSAVAPAMPRKSWLQSLFLIFTRFNAT
jgi:hypothetical protein